jgi:hypothetical protein
MNLKHNSYSRLYIPIVIRVGSLYTNEITKLILTKLVRRHSALYRKINKAGVNLYVRGE